MNYFYILFAVIGYLIGSIPFALVIGKGFYGIDVRDHGSGNLGGTNSGRVLGKKAGATVIILDILKCSIAVLITRLLINTFDLDMFGIHIAALFAAIGHCWPIFAGFRGGKAVSVVVGYMLATNIALLLIAAAIFLPMLKITKYQSLSAITTALILLGVFPFVDRDYRAWIVYAIIAALLIYRHKENIKRLINHTESKIKWL